MQGERLTYNQLLASGWSLAEGEGVSTPRSTSVAFCLTRHGHQVKSVQGYGRTRREALDAATSEANAWLEAERILAYHRQHRPPRD